MIIDYHKNFDKEFEKLTKNDKIKVVECIELFRKDKFNPKLRNHKLSGKYSNHRSISAGGDLRLHYREKGDKITIIFVSVGSHSELYG